MKSDQPVDARTGDKAGASKPRTIRAGEAALGWAVAGSACLLVLVAGLAFGAWRYYRAPRRSSPMRTNSGATSCPTCASRRCSASPTVSIVVICRRRRRRSPRPISLRAPAAISRSAMSISAITSRRASCSPRSPRPRLDHQIAQAEATLPERGDACSKRRPIRDLAARHLGTRQAARQERLGDAAAGRRRSPDPAGAAGRRAASRNPTSSRSRRRSRCCSSRRTIRAWSLRSTA